MSGIGLFVAAIVVFGLMNVVFAFVEPPGPLRSLFKVPAIFAFLPARLVVPVGRLFVAASSFVVAGFLAIRVLGVLGSR